MKQKAICGAIRMVLNFKEELFYTPDFALANPVG